MTPNTITENTVLIALTMRMPGLERKCSKTILDTDADKEMVNASKTILESEEFEAVERLDGEIGRYIQKRSFPSGLKKGVYLLPVSLVEQTVARLWDYKHERGQKVNAFLEKYEQAKNAARKRLKSLYSAANYPDAWQMRVKFSMEWNIIETRTPAMLCGISETIYQDERRKAVEKAQEMAEECRFALREQMQALVSHMIERLSGKDDGKPKSFHDTMVTNMAEFLSVVDHLNVTGDGAIASLAEQARAITNGLAPEALRRSHSLRAQVREQFESIKPIIDSAVRERPKRSYRAD